MEGLAACRRGFVYRQGSNWTQRHLSWLRSLLAQGLLAEEDHGVLSEYLALLEYKLSRREELDQRIEALALLPQYTRAVDRLTCFRGIDTHAARVLATQIGDSRRVASPRQLMAYRGLVPREHSSGERRRQGAITTTGNSHCRHVLIHAAGSYRRPPTRSAPLKRRQRAQPPQVMAPAGKAQQCLCKLLRRIAARQCRPVAATAAARELIGFLWAVMQEVAPLTQEQPQAA